MTDLISNYLSVKVICIFALIILAQAVMHNVLFSSNMKKQFALAALIAIAVIAAELVSVVYENVHNAGRFQALIANTIGFSLSPFIAIVLSRAFSVGKGKVISLLSGFVWINCLLVISSPWTGMVFYISADNSYLRGPLFGVYVLAYLCSYAILIIDSIKAMKFYQCHEKSTFIMLLVFTIVGTTVQLLLPFVHVAWTLYHYYWDEHIWHSKEITRLTAGYRLSPFYADMSDKYIHLVYRGLATHQYQIFYCRYHLEHAIWSSPENVTQEAADCNMPSLLIKDDLLHLTWVTLSKTDLIVKYKYKPIRSLGKVEWSQPVQLNREGSNASFPRLIWAEGKLWCLWYQADNLFGASSSKGENWSEPSSLPEFERTNFHNIHYSTNQSREKEIFQLQWILGNLDKTFSLPIVGPLMELPEYSPAPPATLWEDNKNIEVTNGKESVNETIKESLMEASKESAKDPIESDSQNIREKAPRRNASAGAHSLESILFTEFDRQEEFHYSVITKLEEQAKLDESILKELSQALMFAKQNYETLQALKNEVELIKQDVRQLKKRGWFNRMFHNES
jgi:uncharacterized protein YqgC (DUF456 family)